MHSCTLDGMITPGHIWDIPSPSLSYGNTDRGLDGRQTVVVPGASSPNQGKLRSFFRAQLPPLPWESLCWSRMNVSRSPSFVERPWSQQLGENATPSAEDRKEARVGIGTGREKPRAPNMICSWWECRDFRRMHPRKAAPSWPSSTCYMDQSSERRTDTKEARARHVSWGPKTKNLPPSAAAAAVRWEKGSKRSSVWPGSPVMTFLPLLRL